MNEKPVRRFGRFFPLYMLSIMVSSQIGFNVAVGKIGSWWLAVGFDFLLMLLGIYLYNKAMKSDNENDIAILPVRNIFLPWPKPAILLLLFALIEIIVLIPLYAYQTSPCSNVDLIRRFNGCVMRFQAGHFIPSVAFSADGKVFATSEFNGPIQIWSYPEMMLISNLGNQWPLPRTMVLSSKGEMIAICDYDAPLSILDTKTGKVLHTLLSQDEGICDVAFTADDNLLFSVSAAGLQVWDVATGNLITVLKKDSGLQLAMSPDGRFFAEGGANKDIHIWRVADRMLLKTINEPDMHSMVISNDGKYLYTVVISQSSLKVNALLADSVIHVWNLDSGEIENAMTFQAIQLFHLAASRSASGFAAGEVACYKQVSIFNAACSYFWRTGHDKTPVNLLFPSDTYSMAFSPTDNRLLIGNATGIYIWQIP